MFVHRQTAALNVIFYAHITCSIYCCGGRVMHSSIYDNYSNLCMAASFVLVTFVVPAFYSSVATLLEHNVYAFPVGV